MPTPEEILAELPEGEPMTAEELFLCLPYSETDQWARALLGQFASGRSRLVGPPGLLELMAGLLSGLNEREIVDLFLDLTAVDEPIMAALERTCESALHSKGSPAETYPPARVWVTPGRALSRGAHAVEALDDNGVPPTAV